MGGAPRNPVSEAMTAPMPNGSSTSPGATISAADRPRPSDQEDDGGSPGLHGFTRYRCGVVGAARSLALRSADELRPPPRALAHRESPSAPLRLLTVHAHPDDEASKGASDGRQVRAEGIAATLVCCTGGEAGDVLNPAMDRPEVRDRLSEVRLEELAAATAIIGYDTVELLGYHDSGMPDSPRTTPGPTTSGTPTLDEAVGAPGARSSAATGRR